MAPMETTTDAEVYVVVGSMRSVSQDNINRQEAFLIMRQYTDTRVDQAMADEDVERQHAA